MGEERLVVEHGPWRGVREGDERKEEHDDVVSEHFL